MTFVLWYEREAAVFFWVEQEEAIIAKITIIIENLIFEIEDLIVDTFNLVQSFHMALRSNEFLEIKRFIVGQFLGC